MSEREAEAQKSKPTAAATQLPGLEIETEKSKSAPTTTAALVNTKAKKSKLRARKAPITLTPLAVSQLQALFEQPESKFIRIGVKNRGCSGLAYHLEYVDKAGAFDEAVEQDGVKVLIDSKALFSIIGSEMDWLEDKLSARFIFKNPNISKSGYSVSIIVKDWADNDRSGAMWMRRVVQHFIATDRKFKERTIIDGHSVSHLIWHSDWMGHTAYTRHREPLRMNNSRRASKTVPIHVVRAPDHGLRYHSQWDMPYLRW